MNMTWLTQGSGLVAKQEVHRFIRDCIVKAGAPEDNANIVADLLVEADYRGIFSHGLNELEIFVKHIMSKRYNATAHPVVLKESPATAWVDGCNGLGPVVGQFCMDLAIKKAADVGVGWVVAKGSNDYGICAYYSMQALDRGMIGFTCSNTPPYMTPTRATKSFLGANPLSLAAPARYGDSLVLDMATTTVAMKKLEVKRREESRVPEGWALDDNGHPVTDPVAALRMTNLTPLGVTEENASYKGTGLALMVEALSGILAGAAYGPHVSLGRDDTKESFNLGQCFVAIDIVCFAPHYEERLYDLLYRLRGMDPKQRDKKVMAAGDPERAHMKKVDHAGGISYHGNSLKMASALAQMLDVEPLYIK